MDAPAPVPVRPLPGDDFEHGMRFACPRCDGRVWATADRSRPRADPFAPVSCPHCGRDIHLHVNAALRDARLTALRDRDIRLSAHPV